MSADLSASSGPTTTRVDEQWSAGYQAASTEARYCGQCGRHLTEWSGEYAPGAPCMGCGRYPAAASGVMVPVAEVRGIRFRVETACDGYANLMDDDVPSDWDDASYQAGAAAAAAAIRDALTLTSSEAAVAELRARLAGEGR